MTSWRHLFLCVFLGTVDLSTEECGDHFVDMRDWGGNLSDTISLVRTKDPKDTMECTLEGECLRGTDLGCELLSDCYERECEKKSEKCEGDSQKIFFYHFMCLLAKATNVTVQGCEYDTVCELYSKITSPDSDQKTTLPPTTTTLPSPTTLPKTTTTLPPTTTVTQRSVTGCTEKHSGNENEKGTLILKIILLLSVILNVVTLAFCLYMRHQRTQVRIQLNSVLDLNGYLPGDQPMTELKSTPLAFGNGAVETTNLMQPSECHSALTHSSERL